MGYSFLGISGWTHAGFLMEVGVWGFEARIARGGGFILQSEVDGWVVLFLFCFYFALLKLFMFTESCRRELLASRECLCLALSVLMGCFYQFLLRYLLRASLIGRRLVHGFAALQRVRLSWTTVWSRLSVCLHYRCSKFYGKMTICYVLVRFVAVWRRSTLVHGWG